MTLNKIYHENVIAVVEADRFRDKKGLLHMLLLTEYCSGGSLNERLAQPSSEEMNLKWISRQIEFPGALATFLENFRRYYFSPVNFVSPRLTAPVSPMREAR